MTHPADETCWSMVQAAAEGDSPARDRFATTYMEAVRRYLRARWAGRGLVARVDDAVQDVFLECFRDRGALERLEERDPRSFRAWLFGLVRNIARRHEERLGRHDVRSIRLEDDWSGLSADEESLATVFDRAWAQALVDRAAQRHRRLAESRGGEALLRIEILELRFEEGLPIRDIAQRWGRSADELHQAYRKARQEFREMLLEEVRFTMPGSDQATETEFHRVLSLLR